MPYRVVYMDHEKRQCVTQRVENVEDSPLGPFFIRISGFLSLLTNSPLVMPDSMKVEDGITGIHINTQDIRSIVEYDDEKVTTTAAGRLIALPSVDKSPE